MGSQWAHYQYIASLKITNAGKQSNFNMYTNSQVQDIIEKKVAEIYLPDQPSLLYKPVEYILEDGGKRIRPTLTMLAANLYSDTIDQAIGSALAVEVFHNFTLLHDDIMDKALVRRSRATVHRKWNENVAILSGDAMVILAYHLLCEGTKAEHLSEMLKVFNLAAIEVCEGQQYDMDFETRGEVPIGEYIDMIRLKTAVLMAAALEMGAIAGGAEMRQRKAIYEFGINLGLAFQIQDDLLDTYGNPETFGKQIGGDIAVGKKTFLFITALSKADKLQTAELKRMDGTVEERFRRTRDIYDQLGVKEEAEKAIAEYFRKALSVLEGCPDSGDRSQPLLEYAHSLMQREK